MRGREKGVLLLTSHLGDPDRKILTLAQFRTLAQAVTGSGITKREGDVTERDLMALGFDRAFSRRVLHLFSQKEQMEGYLNIAAEADCLLLTRVSDGYPVLLRRRLGLDSPGCLWLKGDPTLLFGPMISLVGSRDLQRPNCEFAYEAGKQAALQGFTLVSGNARGADTVAQEACLQHGGKVVSVVADRLTDHPLRERVLYISEDSYDLTFSAQRALSRNRIIHALPNGVLVAQCTLGRGGTWDGTTKNLKGDWSPVFCFADGSPAFTELTQMGAVPIRQQELADLSSLKPEQNLFDQ